MQLPPHAKIVAQGKCQLKVLGRVLNVEQALSQISLSVHSVLPGKYPQLHQIQMRIALHAQQVTCHAVCNTCGHTYHAVCAKDSCTVTVVSFVCLPACNAVCNRQKGCGWRCCLLQLCNWPIF